MYYVLIWFFGGEREDLTDKPRIADLWVWGGGQAAPHRLDAGKSAPPPPPPSGAWGCGAVAKRRWASPTKAKRGAAASSAGVTA